jgi:predicted deacylase
MAGSLGPIPLPEAGQKQSGYFTFQADPLLARYTWPFFSIVGAQPGPTFLITAGIHAAEYTGVEAAIRLGRLLDPAELSGTVVIIPLLNRPGFYERSIYVNPEDNDNMNRVFPGSPDGTWSERFAHYLLNDVVSGVQFSIDLHAGDLIEDLVPFVGYRESGRPENDQMMLTMMAAYGAAWSVRRLPSGERVGLLYAAAAERGVAAILAESGRNGLLEEDAVQRHVDGVLNILRTVGILAGAPVAVPPPTLLTRFDWLRSEHEGIFHCAVKVNDQVKAGQVLGEMVDLLGNPLGQITAPADGVVLFLVTSPAIKADGLLMGIGVPES